MNDDQHPDLIEEAAILSVREAFELASIAAAVAQFVARRAAEIQLERAARVQQAKAARRAQSEADFATLRAGWVPANDPGWLRETSLAEVFTTWCRAIKYADLPDAPFTDDALRAVANCEDRLRELHPHAMARYDRLRFDGLGPEEAMQQTVPLFLRSPVIHERPKAPLRLSLEAGDELTWTSTVLGPSREEFESYQNAEKILNRSAQISRGLHTRGLGDEFTAQDMGAALEMATNLPPEAIRATVTREPWQNDFPLSIEDVLAVASGNTARALSQRPERTRYQRAKSPERERRTP